jgi:uncharacterized protein YdaU (DUF1376 family)
VQKRDSFRPFFGAKKERRKAVNYYNRFPGDYARDTKHLSLEEHGVYTLLLDALYGTEKPLPNNKKILFRMCNAITKKQQNAVKKVLAEFFSRNPDGFSNKRFEIELKHSRARIYAARTNGKKGGRPRKRKPNGNPDHNPGHNPEKSSPSSILHPKASRDGSSSQVTSNGAAADRGGSSAAFSDIGFPEPFGHPSFRDVWAKNYRLAKAQGTWLTIAMERTIQECNALAIRVPPQFFDAKRTVETIEERECKARQNQKAPL